MEAIPGGREVTVSCAGGEVGRVYDGVLPFEATEIDPASVGETRTKIMMNPALPEQAFRAARLLVPTKLRVSEVEKRLRNGA